MTRIWMEKNIIMKGVLRTFIYVMNGEKHNNEECFAYFHLWARHVSIPHQIYKSHWSSIDLNDTTRVSYFYFASLWTQVTYFYFGVYGPKWHNLQIWEFMDLSDTSWHI
jgi:hypothetical protein